MKTIKNTLLIVFASLNLIAFGADPRSPEGAEPTQRQLDIASLQTPETFAAIAGIARMAGKVLNINTFNQLTVDANLDPSLAHLSPDMRLLNTATSYFIKALYIESAAPTMR